MIDPEALGEEGTSLALAPPAWPRLASSARRGFWMLPEAHRT